MFSTSMPTKQRVSRLIGLVVDSMKLKTLHVLLLTIVLALLGAATSEAQYRGGRGSWRGLDSKAREARHQFVVEVVDELKRSVGEKLQGDMLSRFEGMARSVVRRMSKEDFEKLQSRPIAERVKGVATLWQKSKEQTAERFIKSQTPKIATELRALKPEMRDRRIAELKVLTTLERSISSAEKYQLIQPTEADRLRGLPSAEQLVESNKLNRQVFFSMHGAEIDAKEKARLEKLDDRIFWRDRKVRRFQLLRHINAKELAELRKLDRNARMKLFKALRTGNGLEDFVEAGTLSQQTVANWAKMKHEDRRRLARDLSSVYLPNFQQGLRPSRKQMSQLSREERRQLFMMNAKERLKFLKTKFPDGDWDKQEGVRRLRNKIDNELKTMDRRSRSELRSMMPSIVSKKLTTLFPGDTAKVTRLMVDMEKVGWFRSVVPAMRSLKGQLSIAERKNVQSMTTVETVDFYFSRFPAELTKQAAEQLTSAGHKLPVGWIDLSGSKKVHHLNDLGLKMPWGPKDSMRRFRGRRPDMGPPKDGSDRHGGNPKNGRRRGRPHSRPSDRK
ncbi:MAG: hypothetical protein ACI97A_000174 [Planctomycetota bacterium]|jgi:hypothetical protein